MNAIEIQIVVYQTNEIVRLDVHLKNETVWLTQSQMATLFGCSADNVGLHLKRPRASLKCLGSKCLAFTKLDAGEICRIKKSAFASGARARGLV